MSGAGEENRMGEEVSVRVFKTVPELEQLRPVWESWPGHQESDLDFYLNFVETSKETKRPHVLLLSRGGQPDAIMVGRLDHRPTGFGIGYLRVSVKADLLFFAAGSVRGNASSENCRVFIEELRRSLKKGEADAVFFHHVHTESALYPLLRKIPGFFTRDHVSDTRPHFSKRLPARKEDFQAGLSQYFKRKLKANKLSKDFPKGVQVRCFTALCDLDTLMHDAEQVASKSYQRGLGVGFSDTPQERERLAMKARKGWLRAYILYIGDRPAAFWVGDVNDATFGSDYLGHDPDFAKYSPGLYLILKVMEDLCSRVREVDFAAGAAEYKEALSDHEWHEGNAFIFAPSFKGLRLAAARFMIGGLHRTLKKALARLGFLQTLKSAWRARLRKGEAAQEAPST
jgi:hypothetical protein